MSKTDKTAPFWVGLARGEHASRPEHFCGGVDCDLPESPADEPRKWSDTKCHWTFVYTGKNICGCPLCTDSRGRRSERRRDRHEAKRALRRGDTDSI